MNNIKKVGIGIVIIVLIILIPFILDALYSTHLYDSHLEASHWASFNGGYIGAIMGGVVTLIGIWITIKFQQTQAKEDRRLSIAPYLMHNIYDHEELLKIKYDLNAICDFDFEHDQNFNAVIRVKNIGMGPAININIYDVFFKGKESNYQKGQHYDVLEKDGEFFMMVFIGVRLVQTEPDKDCLIKEGILSLRVGYEDLFQNKYEQNVEIFMRLWYFHNEAKNIWKSKSPDLKVIKTNTIIN